MTEFAFFSEINDVLSEFANVRNMSECRGDIMTIGCFTGVFYTFKSLPKPVERILEVS